MKFVLTARDKPGALETRLANRDAHLTYVRETGVVEQAGPILNQDGEMCGSILVLELDDLGAAQAWAKEDPYARAGLFESVTIDIWKRVVG